MCIRSAGKISRSGKKRAGVCVRPVKAAWGRSYEEGAAAKDEYIMYGCRDVRYAGDRV